MREYLNNQVKSKKQLEIEAKIENRKREFELMQKRMQDSAQRELSRDQWLKMQMKCSNYLNRLNRLYKDS